MQPGRRIVSVARAHHGLSFKFKEKAMKKLQTFLLRPRYLRAIPSLVVLTTAMAWSVPPDSDAADVQQKRAGVAVSQTLGAVTEISGGGKLVG
jgi:hypothetical protein